MRGRPQHALKRSKTDKLNTVIERPAIRGIIDAFVGEGCEGITATLGAVPRGTGR